MAAITVKNIDADGESLTFVSASAGGDTVACSDTNPTFLYVKNGGGSSITVGCTAITKCSQGFSHDLATSIDAGSETIIKLDSRFINRQTGLVSVTYSAVTSVTVAAFVKA